MTLAGVDLSAYQGQPGNWKDSAGAIAWAGVKISELSSAGLYISPDAAADWAYLKAHGKGRVGYLFGHPATGPAATVSLFADELARLGLDDGDGVALDLEVTDGRPAAQVAVWARGVMAQLEHVLNRPPVLYTFLSFAQGGNCAGLGGYPLWIADPSSPAGHPRVPGPWSGWAIHQHSITGAIDRDVAAYGSLAAMRAQLGKKGAPVATVQTIDWKAAGSSKTLAELAADRKVAPSTILRLTAQHGQGGKFPGPVAAWLDGVFTGNVAPSAAIPADVVLRVPAP
jgi:lysozyme